MTASVQVLGISNAIVDVLAHVDDEFLTRIEAPKGSMTLIDAQRAQEVYAMMGPATEMSGGSVANTIAGMANLGASAAYIGRVAEDDLGRIFAHDMQSLGVDVRVPPSPDGAPTARCYVLITPDGQRTMQTYLGACIELEQANVTEASFGAPELILLEGYVWDTPHGQGAVNTAMQMATRRGAAVALSLSDADCVDRHRGAFRRAIEEHVTIVVADDTEAMSLFEVDTFDAAADRAADVDCLFALTRSEQGSVIVNRGERIEQAAYPVEKVVDTTGAGDAYAAAFLYGWVNRRSLSECSDLGSWAGAVVVQQLGARLEKDALAGHPAL